MISVNCELMVDISCLISSTWIGFKATCNTLLLAHQPALPIAFQAWNLITLSKGLIFSDKSNHN